ncbi:MAG TPA: M48 family metallopeptidase [Gemmataceae bacterium]|jgi:STE24 endopeptidase|nr:M48 family metallopeptidase [Gemmataceae bacterium]
MKAVFAVAAMVLVFLVVTSQLQPSIEIVREAEKNGFSVQEIADGRYFAWERRWIFWSRAAVDFLFLSGLALLPIGRRIQEVVGERVGYRWWPQVAILGAIAWVGLWALNLPFRVAGYLLSRSWDMTGQSPLSWLGDVLLQFLIETLAQGFAFLCLYGLMRAAPKFWWLAAGVGSMVLAAFFALMLPEVVAPMFNKFTPLSKTKYAELETRLKNLGKPLGISTDAIYVVDASRQSNHTNAYFTGIGPRQQIVLYDTLLAKNTPDEVETVVAHEMGHWWHGHIYLGILYGGIALTIGLFGLNRILVRHVETGEWRSVGDPAGIFLVLWLGSLATAAIIPIESAISRHFERQADEMSLKLSKKPAAFISAEIRLAKDNKMDVAPLPWNVLLFASHPTTIERINAAKEWKDPG